MHRILLTLFVIPLVLGTTPKEDLKPVVVLELFTSQGCSSCPPADRLLDKVLETKKDYNIIGLSYHVDYWNYIGWTDPFSKKEFSDKQRDYSTKFNSSTIYTPQIVVNGKEHFVGSNRGIMDSKLRQYLSENATHVITVSNVDRQEELVSFEYSVLGEVEDLRLNVLLVLDEKVTQVQRGENRNRTLKNTNIVISENSFSLKTVNGKGSVLIPDLVESQDNISLVVLLKNKNLDILAGTQVKL